MSQESIELAIGKALLDVEFRELLFANPEEALVDFYLTAAEKSGLLHLDSETLDWLAKNLDWGLLPAEGCTHKKRKKS